MEIGKKKIVKLLFLGLLLAFVSCTTKPKQTVTGVTAVPHTIIYKTKKNYHLYVPITLSKDKKSILSYPAPKDIYYQGKLAYPTALKNAYLLDNRGINKNVAFLSYTYEQYSQLKEVPPMDTLWAKILDKDPLLEMYDCGSKYQYKDELSELNKIIDAQFKNCKKIR